MPRPPDRERVLQEQTYGLRSLYSADVYLYPYARNPPFSRESRCERSTNDVRTHSLFQWTVRSSGALFSLAETAPRLLGFSIAVIVTSGHVFLHDGPVPTNPTPIVGNRSAAVANKRRWRLRGFGRD
jgi:hypothetical protein